MMRIDSVFHQARCCYEDLARDLQRRSDLISNIRLAVFFCGAVVTASLFYWSDARWAAVAAAVFLLAFLLILKKHDEVQLRLDYSRAMVEVYSRYQARMTDEWRHFAENGLEFVNSGHGYSQDLDIFGPGSLYQMITTAHTHYGRMRLRELLENHDSSISEILARQEAVRELAAMPGFVYPLESLALMKPAIAKDPEKMLALAEAEHPILRKPVAAYCAFGLPIATAVAVLGWMLGLIPAWPGLTILGIQILAVWLGSGYLVRVLGDAYLMQESVGVYMNQFRLIEAACFSSELAGQLQGRLRRRGRPASEIMQKLEVISEAVSLRYQPIFYMLLNSLVLWDFHCAIRLEQWKVRYGKDMRDWLRSLAEYEALSSLAVTARINCHPGHEENGPLPGMTQEGDHHRGGLNLPDSVPAGKPNWVPNDYFINDPAMNNGLYSRLAQDWCWPEIVPEYGILEARSLGHPLIDGERCVRNDVSLTNDAWIVTGSNMSGKSTLLRAAGINLIMAYAGSPVCAGSMRCSLMEVATSMLIRDDLASGVSTFYAELLRISMLIGKARAGIPVFYLIDEIFRGTNSLDRIAGAQAVLRTLDENGKIGMISTHDFELCDLDREFPGRFLNRHFEEQYIDNRISFDYRLREGRCTTTNARHLMRLVGIETDAPLA